MHNSDSPSARFRKLLDRDPAEAAAFLHRLRENECAELLADVLRDSSEEADPCLRFLSESVALDNQSAAAIHRLVQAHPSDSADLLKTLIALGENGERLIVALLHRTMRTCGAWKKVHYADTDAVTAAVVEHFVSPSRGNNRKWGRILGTVENTEKVDREGLERWFKTVCTNRVYDWFRAKKRIADNEVTVDPIELRTDGSATTPTEELPTDEALELRRREDRLNRGIDDCYERFTRNPEQSDCVPILVLARRGHPPREIALLLGQPGENQQIAFRKYECGHFLIDCLAEKGIRLSQ